MQNSSNQQRKKFWKPHKPTVMKKNPLLNDECIEEEIKKDIWNFLEPYENEKKPPKTLRRIEKVLREKLITLSAYIKNKSGRAPIITMPLYSLEKKTQN